MGEKTLGLFYWGPGSTEVSTLTRWSWPEIIGIRTAGGTPGIALAEEISSSDFGGLPNYLNGKFLWKKIDALVEKGDLNRVATSFIVLSIHWELVNMSEKNTFLGLTSPKFYGGN